MYIVESLVLIYLVVTGQEYIFGGDTQYVPFRQNQNQFINPSNIIPFRQSPTGFEPIDSSSGFLQTDLHTSDLPVHLQHTLPQYRFSSTPSSPNNVSGDFHHQTEKKLLFSVLE